LIGLDKTGVLFLILLFNVIGVEIGGIFDLGLFNGELLLFTLDAKSSGVNNFNFSEFIDNSKFDEPVGKGGVVDEIDIDCDCNVELDICCYIYCCGFCS